jgi:hypothetical protein
MIRLKQGVDLHILAPQAVLGMFVLDGVWGNLGYSILFITSVADGKHSTKSMHRLGMAFDVRLPPVAYEEGNGVARALAESKLHALIGQAKMSLGEDFDVVLEEDHIHVEWDPKGGVG